MTTEILKMIIMLCQMQVGATSTDQQRQLQAQCQLYYISCIRSYDYSDKSPAQKLTECIERRGT